MISRAALSTVVQGQPKYRSMLAGNPSYVPPSFESIATVTAVGSETSLTLSSIPSIYKHLQVRMLSRRTTGTGHIVVMQFNGDTGTNYANHQLYGTSAGAVGGLGNASAANIRVLYANGSTNLANQFGAGVADILDYANTSKYKTLKSFGGHDNNTDGRIELMSGFWMNNASVTSITLSFLGDALAAGSTFALYGIKG
jgi:hypothetical protein